MSKLTKRAAPAPVALSLPFDAPAPARSLTGLPQPVSISPLVAGHFAPPVERDETMAGSTPSFPHSNDAQGEGADMRDLLSGAKGVARTHTKPKKSSPLLSRHEGEDIRVVDGSAGQAEAHGRGRAVLLGGPDEAVAGEVSAPPSTLMGT